MGIGAIDKKYLVLAVLVWTGLVIHTLSADWSTDFQFHTAAIAEFSTNLFDPRHIFVVPELPHHSLSFYHQVWGALASATGLSALSMAQVVAVVNLTALLVVIPPFVRVFDKRPSAPFVALLLFLLAWGPGAWRLSSLLNLNSLGFGLPYPSYFVVWLSMLAVVIVSKVMRDRGLSWLTALLFAFVGFVGSNAHLAIFGAFGLLLVAVVVTAEDAGRRVGLLALLSFGGGALIGALFYPYPPLIDIVTATGVVDDQNRTVYQSVLIRTAPSLLGLVPLVLRRRNWRTDPLVFAFALLLAVYAAGAILRTFVLGRVIVVMMIILQLALTTWFLDIWDRSDQRQRRLAVGVSVVISTMLLALATSALVRMVPTVLLPESVASDTRLDTPVDWLKDVDSILEPDDVVLAPLDLSQFFPTVGPKIVALDPAAFVDDQPERVADTERFFSELDLSVIDDYDVTWIAYTPDLVSPGVAADIDMLGDVVRFDDVVLVSLN